MTRDGFWGMACFNALGPLQQQRVVEHGNLPFGYEPDGGWCPNGAEVEVTTMWDRFPGPRFYCRSCAIDFLTTLVWNDHTDGVA